MLQCRTAGVVLWREAPCFCYAQTRPAQSIWARAGEDSLRGLFLGELRRRYEDASTEEERQQITQAVRFGLAALEGRDIG